MVTQAEILLFIRAANRAETVSLEFTNKFAAMYAAGMSLSIGTAAYDYYADVSQEINELYNVVWPTFVRYQDADLFLEDNPPSPFGKLPTRMQQVNKYIQLNNSMFRIDKAFWRVENCRVKLQQLKGEKH